MRRGKGKDVTEYVKHRSEQLLEDMKKASDPHDKQWYLRVIQELQWAVSPHHNCFIERNEDDD